MDNLEEKLLTEIERAVIRSYDQPLDLDDNLRIMDEAMEICDVGNGFPFVINACREHIMRNFLSCTISEKDVHNWFKSNYKVLLDDKYELIKRKNSPKHIPDFWLLRELEYVPVEIKLNEFNQKALIQLKRYMDFYNCKNGIAVGKSLHCDLPKSIIYVKYEPKEVLEYQE